MGNDRVTSVYDTAEVTSLVEHTHINTKYVCKVNCTVGGTFVRADDHQMLGINGQILYVL